VIWIDKDRIPAGRWPFLVTVRNALLELENSIDDEIDLTEGERTITITGCLWAYRQAITCRVLELAQSATVLWNSRHPVGAIISGRALLETIAIYHSLLRRAEDHAGRREWTEIGELVDRYAFFHSDRRKKKGNKQPAPPPIGRAVRDFIRETEPNAEAFWDQICDTAHPNGERLLRYAGTLGDKKYVRRPSSESEGNLFVALYNALYSCCWFYASEQDFKILLEQIRTGASLPPDHPLMAERDLVDRAADSIMRDIGPMRPGPYSRKKAK